MIGLDTRTIIDILKENPDVKLVIDKIEEPLASTIINYQEIMFGLDFNRKEHEQESKQYELFFDTIFLLAHTRESAQRAALLFKELEKQGKDIGRFDSMIAAVLLQNGVRKIITRNVKHFSRIKGLEVIDY